ncbi:MAG TPA: polysaccharide biosynthesis C-terminal domain-containing protein [Chitinophagaceae bacterium]|nr:polysaccharide biosynthesis C-terminal domain-containing protein [Chitinophagaceae bacterium]
MSEVRRQSIISTIFVYAGFLAGFINTYLFTRQGSPFSTDEYGLTNAFITVGNLMFAFANMGMLPVIYKFYPYYQENLPKRKNDLLTWALVISTLGFCLVTLAGIIFKGLVIRKFQANSELFVQYYKWVFPFGFSLTVYSIFEVFAWNLRKSIFTTFLRELFFRLITTALIFLLSFKLISSFDTFVKLYAFSYGFIALVLLLYLIWKKEFFLSFSISRVTKKFYKKIAAMASFVYVAGFVLMIAQYIDMLIIMSVVGMGAMGVFALGSVVGGLVQAPQRGAIAASIPVLSKAWKDKDYNKINLIYQRSGINLLIVSLGIFLVIWLNYADAVNTFGLKKDYLNSEWIFFCIGIARIVDLGTGVNAQIIGTSTFWRFDLISGVILFFLITPLSYILVKQFGIIGGGISFIASFSVYNLIRIIFLQRKFNMHPFSYKTIYAIIIAVLSYFICYYSFHALHGFWAMVLKSSVFIALYAGAVIYFDLSPDVLPVIDTIKKRSKKIL